MKYGKTAILILSMCCSTLAIAQTAQEIIDNYITFTGGREQWRKIRTITTTGTYNYGGMEFPFTSYSKAPDLYKYVVSANGKSFMQAYDGKEGWRIDGFKEEKTKTKLKGNEARAMANEMDVEIESPLMDYKQKGYGVILEGTDTVDKKICHKIKLIHNIGDTATYFFDSNNYALIKKQALSRNSELRGTILDIFYGDYRKTEGINWPRYIRCVASGQDILIITIKDIQLNKPVDDTIFRY